jgi:hypothetical protein
LAAWMQNWRLLVVHGVDSWASPSFFMTCQIPQTVCHWGVLTIGVKPGFFQGSRCGPRLCMHRLVQKFINRIWFRDHADCGYSGTASLVGARGPSFGGAFILAEVGRHAGCLMTLTCVHNFQHKSWALLRKPVGASSLTGTPGFASFNLALWFFGMRRR